MVIYVLDKSFKKIGFPIDEYISCIWHTSFFEIGDFELYLNAKTDVLNLLRSGTYLVRDKDMQGNTYKNVMIIKSIKIDSDEETGDHITVTGKDLKEILTRRVILDSSVYPGWTGSIITQVFEENFSKPVNTARKIPNMDFWYEGDNNYSYIHGSDILNNNAGEWIMEQCKSVGCGIISEVTAKGVYAGNIDYYAKKMRRAENIIFSSDYGNLLNSSYAYNSENYKNVAVVAGEEINGERIIKIVNDNISGIDRIETYIDSSTSKDNYNTDSTAYTDALNSEGEKSLQETAVEETFECDVDAHSQFELDKDFFLGDKVSVINDYGITAEAVITDVIDTHDETGRTIIPQFDTFEVT